MKGKNAPALLDLTHCLVDVARVFPCVSMGWCSRGILQKPEPLIFVHHYWLHTLEPLLQDEHQKDSLLEELGDRGLL